MDMPMNAVKKMLLWILSSGVGLVAGGIVVTPVIALMNYFAQDGPIFPAPMVAFVVVAPVSVILFVFQGSVLVYEWIAKRNLGNALLWIGAAGGLVAGLIPYFLAIAPFQSSPDYQARLAFGGLGTFQGLIVFGCQWVANTSRITASR